LEVLFFNKTLSCLEESEHVMKNIHSRKPNFPLNTEKNWPALLQKSFSAIPCQHCHYISYCEDS